MAALAMGLVAASQPGIRQRLSEGYDGDTIFHLGALGALGLCVLSVVMIAVLFALADLLSWRFNGTDRGRGTIARLVWETAARIAFFVLLLTVSPQVYYLYFRTVIEGLPLQWVVRAPEWGAIAGALRFTTGTTAAHLVGASFWALLMVGGWTVLGGSGLIWRLGWTLAILAVAMVV